MKSLAIQWTGGLSFESADDGPPLTIASGDPSTPSPMQLLIYGVMGCMAMDVAHVLARGRHQLGDMKVRFNGERAESHPRRLTAIALHFDVTTSAPREAVERAIELSRTKYCPAANSLRTDIAFTTSLTLHAADSVQARGDA
jgi:putative redox protein